MYETAIERGVCGAKRAAILWVQRLGPGQPVFFYDTTTNRVYSVRHTVTSGGLDLDADAWPGAGASRLCMLSDSRSLEASDACSWHGAALGHVSADS